MDGGSAFLEILFFGMVAAFLIFRLRSVLGRRMGHERDPNAENEPVSRREAPANEDNVIAMPGKQVSSDPVERGVAEIQSGDSSFDPDEFVTGAKTAFELILNAFANGDRDTLRSLTSNSVYAMMDQEMQRRETADQTLESTLVRIDDAKIVAASLRGPLAQVTLRIESEQINVMSDGDGHAVEGHHGTTEAITDVWTFARDISSSDPNWELAEIQDAPAED